MPPRIWISELTFSDGSTLRLNSGDVVVIVGPNNAGKSATLRAIRDKVKASGHLSPIVTALSIGREGTPDDFAEWLKAFARLRTDSNPNTPIYEFYGTWFALDIAKANWSNPVSNLQEVTRLFCHLLTADERLTAANPANAIALTREAYTHPIHYVQRDDKLERRISDHFRKAFGVDLIIHRNAGSKVPLYVGDRPILDPGEDRVTYAYNLRLETLPSVETQGDGMRSFAGVLLHTLVGHESILMVDEPEAFLHPPQARLLGQMLVGDKPEARQLFVATHSGDVLRGVLDGNSGNVRIVRIRRDGSVNAIKELDGESVKTLWTDPLLRSSNILDGVFHEKVIVTESDGDARFFAAVMDALYDGPLADLRKPDVMFVHCGGKDRLPMVVRSLRALAVPVMAVADFDILNDEKPMAPLVDAAGGTWESLRPMWNNVKNAIEAIKPQLSTEEVRREIAEVLADVTTPAFPSQARRKIEEIVKKTSPWSLAKRSGKAFVPSGTATQEYNKLVAALRSLGIFVVEVGELERFYPRSAHIKLDSGIGLR